jgi:ABC-2 type transport system ATP-binding protein
MPPRETSVTDDLIVARGLGKSFGTTRALNDVSFAVKAGRIVGLIGPNGAGKTTALKALLGLTRFEGELSVLGLDPYRRRHQLMQDVCFIADVAVLPRWIRVRQLIDFVAATHPRFRRDVCEHFLARTDIKRASRVKELSKGMVTQLHLALVMAIDARLLVLDEPTLGLDILMRKQFYETLLNEYFDEQRTILVTTHQVEEVEHILTDLLFIDRGRIVLDAAMDEVQEKYAQVAVRPEHLAAARTHKPLAERQGLGRTHMLFRGVNRADLERLGEVGVPSVADLFVSVIQGARA